MAMILNNGIEITWLGHATFKVQHEGKCILIDPWVYNNPACPESFKLLDRIDFMCITHGHFDHIGDAIELAKQYKLQVIGIFELCLYLESKGVENTNPMNKGGTQVIDGIRYTMVHADHSCGIKDGDHVIYAGEAVGFVITFPNGFKIYHGGDTNVFSDMALIRELYAPDLIMIPIGDLYTMSPREAAKACELLQPKHVIPMHYGTFPELTGTPAEFRKLTNHLKLQIHELKPGETLK
jgi:L-ascorbate metabolism protein UlaG (beta-lactamase superfamily)